MDTVKRNRYESYDGKGCPVEATLELFSGKGKGMILFHLLDGTLRFNELKRRVGCITQRMLTKQLRELEAYGLVHRKVYPEVPPKVEYSLTATGQTLEPILLALKSWGEQHAMPTLAAIKSEAELSGHS
ncbi:helix-turn-helix transcriptional regulator [Ferrimonas sediminicola]|uniref:Helix-turn-helix transcriptional regulator n=1 Tax=Ferrimonas sediminicola TaxID=2569538 RepID=A0A4U1BCU4_9GAMM|nr:helix-turn-helix domain-containing protein [Ferrimonas sediminicola]TKB48833.1 helix-turn-helix transcriptional regulator [Ferrimonas sediminicola]